MLEKLKEIKRIDDENEEKRNAEIVVEFQKVANDLLAKNLQDRLNEVISSGNYAFKNNILKFMANGYETKDEKEFMANGFEHTIGFDRPFSQQEDITSIETTGGGCCGDIGIKYENGNFYVTNEKGQNGIVVDENIAEKIYKNGGIRKVILAKQWLESFSNGVEVFANKFEKRIDEMLEERKKI